ncbi:MAG: hypothetical protein AB1512_22300 [Thermodesulfobacteriota bacterium]
MKVLQGLARLLAGADSLSAKMSDPRFYQDSLSPKDQRSLFHDAIVQSWRDRLLLSLANK